MEKGTRRKVWIRENSWLARIAARRLGYASIAMVVGHTIHLHQTSIARFLARPSWVRHELMHVAQYERLGFFGFLWKYLLLSRKYGYYENPLEVEARAAEQDDTLLARYDLSAYQYPEKDHAS